MRSKGSPAYKAFLGRLVTARKQCGLTQVQVAAALGIWQSRIARMESGERRVDVVELTAFAKLYRKPLAWFVQTK
jgi:transcriptional regulator with XRE-family HTH domain